MSFPRGPVHGALPPGADSYELALDLEHNILTRVRARADGRDFVTIETTELTFDLELSADVFRGKSPLGR